MSADQLIDQTKHLIAIPSTADNPAALEQALEFIAGIISAHPHIKIERFSRGGKPSLLAYKDGKRPGNFDILLNVHLDVVPASPEQFKPVVKNGRLYGRGALDMKGTTAVLTDVFCQTVGQVDYSLGLQVVTDEETTGLNGTGLQVENGVRAKLVVIGEYSNSPHTIYNAARGVCWAQIAFSGKSAHGGHLWHGDNAVVKAGKFAQTLLNHYPIPAQESWLTTANIAHISTPNHTYNLVPDTALLKIDFRYIKGDPVFASRDAFAKFIAQLDPEAQIMSLDMYVPAIQTDQNDPRLQALAAVSHKVTGIKPVFASRPAASDGRFYEPFNAAIVEYGLLGQGSHSAGEYVELSSFEEYQKIMQAFLTAPGI